MQPSEAGRGAPHRTELDLDQVVSREPPVEDAVAAELAFQALLKRLPDGTDRTIAEMRRQGCSIQEIADRLGLAPNDRTEAEGH